MAELANDPAASAGVLLRPVLAREISGVHPDMDDDGLLATGKKLLQFFRERCEAAVVADH